MRNKFKNILVFVAIYLISFVGLCSYWFVNHFSGVGIRGIIFTLKAPAEGTDPTIVNSFIIHVVIASAVIAIFYFSVSRLSHLRIRVKNWERNIRASIVALTLLILVSSINVVNAAQAVSLLDYIDSQINKSSIYEEYYVDPKSVAVTFPQQKRNLIYIVLESMESTFTSIENGGVFEQSLIPNLENLQQEYPSFSTNDLNAGEYTVGGTGFTVGSLVAQSAGIPLTLPIDGNSYTGYGTFLPGAYAIGDVLEANGYNQVFMCGSDADFGGRSSYYTTHGNYEINDYNYAIERGWIEEDYRVFWGYEDTKLFDFSKIRLSELASEDEPFNFTMLTVNTHSPEGWVEAACEDLYEEQYSNVIHYSDQQVAAFLDWIMEQDFYDNTTIIIKGDHESMSSEYLSDLDSYTRTPYNVIINPAVTTMNTKNRAFSHMDWYPTTLGAMGAKIEGERLGLGTNMFSDVPTLMEELSVRTVAGQICDKSDFYDNYLLYGSK